MVRNTLTENEIGAVADARVVLNNFYQLYPMAQPPMIKDHRLQTLIDEVCATGPADRLGIESNVATLVMMDLEKMYGL